VLGVNSPVAFPSTRISHSGFDDTISVPELSGALAIAALSMARAVFVGFGAAVATCCFVVVGAFGVGVDGVTFAVATCFVVGVTFAVGAGVGVAGLAVAGFFTTGSAVATCFVAVCFVSAAGSGSRSTDSSRVVFGSR